MSAQVDRELLQLYVLGELDDARSAEVERLVAADPAWAEALQAEATLEVALFDVVDAAPEAAPAVEAGAPWWLSMWRRLRAPAVGLTLALGAALVVVQVSGEPELPAYSMEVQSGEAQLRSAAPTADAPTYTRGSSLSLVLRPATRVLGAPQVRVELDGAPLRGVRVEHLEGGAVEIRGVFGEDLQEPAVGAHRVKVLIGTQDFEHAFTWRAAGS
jgi:anti-sigma factor RsiW